MTWVKVIDVSRYQGPADFRKARALGVDGFIIRATHGETIDPMLHPYHQGALDAGYTDDDLCFYTFCNPKRTTATKGAGIFLDAVHAELGHLRTGLMEDIESYAAETPDPGVRWPAEQYAPWLRTFTETLRADAPEAFTFGYSNDAYWSGNVDTPLLLDDDWLVANLDWVVARYPVYSIAGYAAHPLPGPDGWADWAFGRAAGPVPPKHGTWQAWQFAAGFDGQGPRYGFTSPHLDLNIVRPEAWARWTHRAPAIITPPAVVIPPESRPTGLTQEHDMTVIYNTAPHNEAFPGETRTDWTPGEVKWALIHDGEKWTKDRINGDIYVPGGLEGGKTEEQLARIPNFDGMKFPASTTNVYPTAPPAAYEATVRLNPIGA